MKRKNLGFTLAEVLITLGVIGVVAAMTLPILIANVKGVQYRAQFKKAISILNQAVRINEANYDFNFASISDGYGSKLDNPETKKTINAIFNGSLKGFSDLSYTGSSGYSIQPVNGKGRKVYELSGLPGEFHYPIGLYNYGDFKFVTAMSLTSLYQLSDGAIIAFPKDYTECVAVHLGVGEKWYEKDCSNGYAGLGFIDVNGLALPNTEVKCTTGTLSKDVSEPCTVDNKDITDIFPVIYHDSIVEPATNAAAYVLGN